MKTLGTGDYRKIKEIIKNGDSQAFAEHAGMLVEAGDQRSLMCLIDAACSDNEECSKTAVDHILYTGMKGLKLLFSNFDVRTYGQRCKVYKRLAQKEEQSIKILFTLLDSPDESTYYWAFDALNRLNPPAYIEYLRSKLYSSYKFKRLCAVKAAGKIKAAELTDDIINLLSDPYGSVSQEAFATLSSMGKTVIQRILNVFGETGHSNPRGEEDSPEDQRKERLRKLIENISGTESSTPFFNLERGISSRRETVLFDHLKDENGLLNDYYKAFLADFEEGKILWEDNLISTEDVAVLSESEIDSALFEFLLTRDDNFYIEKAEKISSQGMTVFIPFLVSLNCLAGSRALSRIFKREDMTPFQRLRCLKELSRRGAQALVMDSIWKIVDNSSGFEDTPLNAGVKTENEVKLLEICLICLNNNVDFKERSRILPFFKHHDFRVRSASRIALEA